MRRRKQSLRDTRCLLCVRMSSGWLNRCLGEIVVGGIDTNIALFQDLLHQPDILSGSYDIHWLERWMAANAG